MHNLKVKLFLEKSKRHWHPTGGKYLHINLELKNPNNGLNIPFLLKFLWSEELLEKCKAYNLFIYICIW